MTASAKTAPSRRAAGNRASGWGPPSSVPSSAPASLDDNFRRAIRVVGAVAGIRTKMVGWMIVKPRVAINTKNCETLPLRSLLSLVALHEPTRRIQAASHVFTFTCISHMSRFSSWPSTLWRPRARMKMTAAPHSATFSPPLILHYERLTFGA